jgi:succinoglycan biosynthesis transport protein ExoP
LNIQQFLLALRARFGVFVLVLTATVLAAAVVSFLLPKTYKATVSLLVDAKDEQSLNN